MKADPHFFKALFFIPDNAEIPVPRLSKTMSGARASCVRKGVASSSNAMHTGGSKMPVRHQGDVERALRDHLVRDADVAAFSAHR